MTEFTFAIVTYNHQKYIEQLLKSIKYTIEKDGNGIAIDIIVSDDCSQDDTYKVAANWIRENRDIFRNVIVETNDVNKGVVANSINCLRQIKTDKFIFIAGDDVCLQNNLFAVADKGGFVISPVIKFTEEGVKCYSLRNFETLLFSKRKDMRKYLCEKLKVEIPFISAGMIWDSRYLTDEMFALMGEYKWIEDIPLWSYILDRKDTVVVICPEPVVGYRIGSGISTSDKHEKNKDFENENIAIQRRFCSLRHSWTRRIYYILERRYYKFFGWSLEAVRNFRIQFMEEEKKANIFLKQLK